MAKQLAFQWTEMYDVYKFCQIIHEHSQEYFWVVLSICELLFINIYRSLFCFKFSNIFA